jgi:hypothetical protein
VKRFNLPGVELAAWYCQQCNAQVASLRVRNGSCVWYGYDGETVAHGTKKHRVEHWNVVDFIDPTSIRNFAVRCERDGRLEDAAGVEAIAAARRRVGGMLPLRALR